MPYVRLWGFESREAMDEFDRAVLEHRLTHEDHRHRCEVREVIRRAVERKSWDKTVSYLQLVEKKRGREAHDRLARDVREQYRLGNRGIGDWKVVQ